MKITFSFTDAHYQELVERAHFMGVSRTAVILLHLYLYEGVFSDLSQEELQLDLNPCEVERNSIQVLVPDPLLSKYQHHKTYFLSGSAYFTGFLNVVIEKTTGLWHTSPTLQERTPTTLSLDQRIIDQVEDFSKETGLQFSVFAAYYVTYAPLPLGTPRSYEATDKVQFGLRLTDRAHYQLKERAIRKKMKPNQVLSLGFQDFMDKKILPGGY